LKRLAINDNGQILGVGIDANQQEHGFLLTPVITPTTTAVTSSVSSSVFAQQVSFHRDRHPESIFRFDAHRKCHLQ